MEERLRLEIHATEAFEGGFISKKIFNLVLELLSSKDMKLRLDKPKFVWKPNPFPSYRTNSQID